MFLEWCTTKYTPRMVFTPLQKHVYCFWSKSHVFCYVLYRVVADLVSRLLPIVTLYIFFDGMAVSNIKLLC